MCIVEIFRDNNVIHTRKFKTWLDAMTYADTLDRRTIDLRIYRS